MSVLIHELRQGWRSLLIWTCAISFMLGVCVLIYPEMSSQMGEISTMFADMGAFTQAFGMDQLNFGEFMGYFAIECGNTLGLGGALFAAITASFSLAKEEKEHTAEFLLTHPISRTRIVFEKLASVFVQIVFLNLVVAVVCTAAILLIGETPDASAIALLFLAYLLLQLEIAAIAFALSAFMRSGAMGAGIGMALGLYFLNIVANLTEKAGFLKYITPFSYTDGAKIVSDLVIPPAYLAVGMGIAAVAVLTAFLHYRKKDIA